MSNVDTVNPVLLDALSDAGTIILEYVQTIGGDMDEEVLQNTPSRFGKGYAELLQGYTEDPSSVMKVFIQETKSTSLILVKDIPFYSLCAHHALPFFGTISIGYIPNGKILGLSKFKRLVNIFAQRLQVQENLTQEISQALNDNLKPLGVMVVSRARHLCFEMRGVNTPGSETVVSSLCGVFEQEAEARQEFLSLLKA